MIRRDENYGTQFWVSSAKGSHTLPEAVKAEQASMHVRKLK